MIGNPFFLLSILISAVFTFFTAAFIVEITLTFLRVNQPRARATMRLLAFGSLLLEMSLHSFGKDNILNPLSCFSCIQKLILSVFFPELQAYLASQQISLISYLAFDTGQSFFSSVFIGWLMITVFMVLRWVISVCFMRKQLQNIIRTSKNYLRPIENALLVEAIESAKSRIVISEEVTIPMAIYTCEIVIPRQLMDDLSREELESIIAHELEHVKACDPLLRLFVSGLSALFWWVPTGWYVRQMEGSQEIACDQAIERYGYDSTALASALFKASQWANEMKRDLICGLTNKGSSILHRMQVILGVNTPPRESIVWASVVVGVEGVVLALCIILF